MKKLLLVLMVVALASFLFVGCFPTTPAEGEGEGEGEAELCPAVSLSGGVDVAGKLYVKAGKEQTITITFGTITEPVNLFVGPCNEKAMPTGVPESSSEVILRTTDKKVYTGTYKFSGECCELYLYLMYGTGEVICKYPVIVDGEGPYAKIKVKVAACPCEDCAVTFTSDWTVTGECEDTVGCCDDDCSGFASWAIDLYDEFPFDECCSLQCATPTDSGSGTACPVDFTTVCLEADEYWVIINLADKVGNETRYIASLVFDEDCEVISGTEYDEANICEDCVPSLPMDGFIGACDTDPVEWLGCEEAELEVCPEVTFDPETPIVGEETTITIDFTGKQTPAGIVSAYVGPSIKTLPLGVPEEAQELVLTKVGVVYTALYTFGQAGTDYIYVTLGCEDCTPCKTGVTVLPLECPEVTISDSIPFDGKTVIDGGEHTITVAFDASVAPVRVFVMEAFWMEIDFSVESGGWYDYWYDYWYYYYDEWGYFVDEFGYVEWYEEWFDEWGHYWEEWYEWMEGSATITGGSLQNVEGIPINTAEVAMTTVDGGKTYTGTINFGWGDCDERWIYVAYGGDPCCMNICDYQVVVDSEGPYALFEVMFDTCEITVDGCWPEEEPGYQFIIWNLIPHECEEETWSCCGDTCSGLASWEVTICMCDPYDECDDYEGCPGCEYASWTGTTCKELEELIGPCVATGNEIWKHRPFWLNIQMTDNLGNVTEYRRTLHYGDPPRYWYVGYCMYIGN